MTPNVKRAIVLLFAIALLMHSKVMLGSGKEETGRLKVNDAGSSVFGYLTFGAFKPLFLNYLWSKGDRLEREGRFWELIDVQERIIRLQPKDSVIRQRQARLIAYNIAQSEPNEVNRWRYYSRALRKINKGIEQDPLNFELRELRFYFYFQLISTDPYVSRQLESKTKRNGLMAALEEAVSMTRDFPDRSITYDMRRVAAEEACEWLMNRGNLKGASQLLKELSLMATEFERRFPNEPVPARWKETYQTWSEILLKMDGAVDWRARPLVVLKNEDNMTQVLDETIKLLETPQSLRLDPEQELLDGSICNFIQLRALGLCQSLVLAKKHDVALRWTGRINRIAHLADGRIGPRMPYYSVAYVNLFEKFVSLDSEILAAKGTGKEDAQAEKRWRDELKSLDQLIRERAKRTDSFRERLIKARP